jgi:tight adherence protein C
VRSVRALTDVVQREPDWTVTALLVIAAASVAVALTAGREPRRARARLRRRLAGPPLGRRRQIAVRAAIWLQRADRLVAGLGAVVRRPARRPPSEAADRIAGWAVLAAVVALVTVGWPGSVLIGGGVLLLPRVQARRMRQRQVVAIGDGLPEVIDLLRVSVDAGLDVATSLATVADHHDDRGPLADALARICQRTGRGDRLIDALAELEALGEPAGALHAALVATVRHGVPLAPPLERAADEARDRRRRRREETVRTLPVKLLFPLVFCTLPALLLLTVVPLLVRSFPSLAP